MELFLRSSPEAVDPSLAPIFISQIFMTQCFQVATVTVLVYDAVITMDKEIKYFWNAPLRTVNITYFANRYIGLFGSVAYLYWNTLRTDLTSCNFSFWSRNVASWFTYILIDYILTLRVLALYSQNKKLSICLKTLLALEAIFKLGLFVDLTLSLHIVTGRLAKDATVCGLDDLPVWQLGMIDWVTTTAYGVLLMVSALYKAADYWRLSAGFKGFKLVRVIVQDQLIYFMLVVVVSVMNIVTARLPIQNATLGNLLSCLGSPSFLSVLGSRLLVNLKEAGEQGLNQGTSYRISSKLVSDIDFAQPNEAGVGGLAEVTSD